MKKNEAGLGSYYVVLVTTAIIILSCIIIYIILKKYIINTGIGFYNDISYTWYYYLFNVFYKSVTYVLYRKNVWA